MLGCFFLMVRVPVRCDVTSTTSTSVVNSDLDVYVQPMTQQQPPPSLWPVVSSTLYASWAENQCHGNVMYSYLS